MQTNELMEKIFKEVKKGFIILVSVKQTEKPPP